MIAEAVYLLCALSSIWCAAMLFRGFRASRTRLLFWSGLCFSGLAVNNTLVFLDLVLVPNVDLSIYRSLTALMALMLLLVGLIWETT